MAKKISASVGKGGKNKPEDTTTVQELLNGFTKQGGFKKLDTDGLIGPKTISAISSFQKNVVGMSRTDGRVDPRGQSMEALNKGPKKVEAEAKKAEKAEQAEQKKQAAKDKKSGSGEAEAAAKPQVKGDTRSVSKQVLSIIEAVSAHYGKAITIEGQSRPSGKLGDPHRLWEDWIDKFESGNKHPALRGNEKLRRDLDRSYKKGDTKKFDKLVSDASRGGGKSQQDNLFAVRGNTDRRALDALATVFQREDQNGVVSFSSGGRSVPRKVTEDMKKKWR